MLLKHNYNIIAFTISIIFKQFLVTNGLASQHIVSQNAVSLMKQQFLYKQCKFLTKSFLLASISLPEFFNKKHVRKVISHFLCEGTEYNGVRFQPPCTATNKYQDGCLLGCCRMQSGRM